MDDVRTPDHRYTISSPISLGSSELKHFNKLRFQVPISISFMTIGELVQAISEGFTHNVLGGHLGHVTHKTAHKHLFPQHMRAPNKIWL